jgi:type VI secretion system protein ImpI
MPLHLAIENEGALPDGGPISCTVTSKRGIDIGRDQYLDWVLPDPTRFISGKHCEVRYRDGKYWLSDVSTNGTFVNRSESRIDGPYPLQNGDRIEIGRYIIAVRVEPEAGSDRPTDAFSTSAPGRAAPDNAAMWNINEETAPAINPRELRSPSVSMGVNSFDVLDWAADIPASTPAYQASTPPSTSAAQLDQADWILQQPRQPDVPRSGLPAARTEQLEPLPPLPEMDTGVPEAETQPSPVLRAVAVPVSEHFPLPPAASAPAPNPLPPVTQPPAVTQENIPAARLESHVPSRFVQRFAKGIGLPEEAIAIRDEGELGELLGTIMQSVANNLSQLHAARAQSKGMMRSSNQTMIQATDNNPLRFSPTAKDALRIMFGPRTESYLEANRAIESSFSDLKKHQMMTFSAMQSAVTKLLEDLDPKKIDTSVDTDKGVSGLIGSRKTKLWERYVTVWQAKTGRNDLGMLGVFMLLFADAYDRSGRD